MRTANTVATPECTTRSVRRCALVRACRYTAGVAKHAAAAAMAASEARPPESFILPRRSRSPRAPHSRAQGQHGEQRVDERNACETANRKRAANKRRLFVLKDDDATKRARLWLDFWLNQFAIVHARFLARCVLNRAAACVDAVNAPCARASIVDVTSAMSKPLPRPSPQPPPPPPPGNASAAAFAPAR